MNPAFIKSVENNNISRVRYALSDQLLIDPRGNLFHEMLTFAESKISNLYEEDNGSRSEKDDSLWDMDFLCQVRNELDRNFSREKLDYYEKVVKYVLKDKARQMDEDEVKQAEIKEEKPKEPVKNWINKNKKPVCAGLVAVGGIALSVIGLCLSEESFPNFSKTAFTALKATFITLGIAGAVIGGIFLYKEIRKK